MSGLRHDVRLKLQTLAGVCMYLTSPTSASLHDFVIHTPSISSSALFGLCGSNIEAKYLGFPFNWPHWLHRCVTSQLCASHSRHMILRSVLALLHIEAEYCGFHFHCSHWLHSCLGSPASPGMSSWPLRFKQVRLCTILGHCGPQ